MCQYVDTTCQHAMKPDLHYTDPKLVSLYDAQNPRGIDTDFYLELACHTGAKNIIDLGCGTGILTRELYQPDRSIVGIDPSKEMIEYAKSRSGASDVAWRIGDASSIGVQNSDLITMSGNVSQVFLKDSDWLATLNHIYKCLRPGGILSFESRNPDAKAWKLWTPEHTFNTVPSQYGPVDCWLELIKAANNLVHFKSHYTFTLSGEVVIVDSILRFRSWLEISNSLKTSGFSVQNTWGTWKKDPFESDNPLMIFTAQRV